MARDRTPTSLCRPDRFGPLLPPSNDHFPVQAPITVLIVQFSTMGAGTVGVVGMGLMEPSRPSGRPPAGPVAMAKSPASWGPNRSIGGRFPIGSRTNHRHDMWVAARSELDVVGCIDRI